MDLSSTTSFITFDYSSSLPGKKYGIGKSLSHIFGTRVLIGFGEKLSNINVFCNQITAHSPKIRVHCTVKNAISTMETASQQFSKKYETKEFYLYSLILIGVFGVTLFINIVTQNKSDVMEKVPDAQWQKINDLPTSKKHSVHTEKRRKE